MDHAGRVQHGEHLADLHADRDRLPPRERPPRVEPLAQVLAADKLHRHVELPAGRATPAERRDEARVRQRGEELDLVEEALLGDRVARAEDLHGDGPRELAIAGQVDDAHPALADRSDQLEAPAQHLAVESRAMGPLHRAEERPPARRSMALGTPLGRAHGTTVR